VKDRDNYLRLAGHHGEGVSWFDITGKDELLKSWGISPYKALTELHVVIGDIEMFERHIQVGVSASNSSHSIKASPNKNTDGIDRAPQVLSELDAYIVLMQRVPLLKPLAWFMNLRLLRPSLAHWYHKAVMKRLKRDGRL